MAKKRGKASSKNNNNNNRKKVKPIFKHKWKFSQIASDKLTQVTGSWGFILGLSLFLLIWMAINFYFIFIKWDPYPFILLNLVLSCLATYQAPIILMSQNRQVQRDRLDSRYDYMVNRKAEREIQDIQKDLEIIKKMIRKKKRM
jgi:uncharacterized membrane protein